MDDFNDFDVADEGAGFLYRTMCKNLILYVCWKLSAMQISSKYNAWYKLAHRCLKLQFVLLSPSNIALARWRGCVVCVDACYWHAINVAVSLSVCFLSRRIETFRKRHEYRPHYYVNNIQIQKQQYNNTLLSLTGKSFYSVGVIF